MIRRTHVLMTTATAAAAVTLLGWGVPALATDATTPLGGAGGVRYKMATTAPGGDAASAGVAAGCDGWKAVAGGYSVDTGPGKGISNTWVGQDKYWYASMWADAGVKAGLTTFAVCLKNPEISSAKQIANDLPAGTAVSKEVFCPEGAAVSGGVLALGDSSDFSLNASFPIDSPADDDTVPDDGWRSFVDYTGDGGDSIHFDISCLENTPLTYRKKTVTVQPGAALSTKAACPKASPVVGGGVYVQGAANMAHVFTSRPFDGKDAKKVPEDGWRAGVRNVSQVPLSLTVHAVCRDGALPQP